MSLLHVTFCLSALFYIALPSYALNETDVTNGGPTFPDLYVFHDEKLSWNDAYAVCDNDGAQLFYPVDETEVTGLLLYLRRNDYHPHSIHVGITDAQQPSAYMTIDGIPIDQVYDEWYPGQPSPIVNNNCVGMYIYSYYTYYNYNCLNENLSFVCKYKTGHVLRASSATNGLGMNPLQKMVQQLSRIADASDRQTLIMELQGVALTRALNFQTTYLAKQSEAMVKIAEVLSGSSQQHNVPKTGEEENPSSTVPSAGVSKTTLLDIIAVTEPTLPKDAAKPQTQ